MSSQSATSSTGSTGPTGSTGTSSLPPARSGGLLSAAAITAPAALMVPAAPAAPGNPLLGLLGGLVFAYGEVVNAVVQVEIQIYQQVQATYQAIIAAYSDRPV
ncbi:MAG: hypothetical protein M3O32_21725, partial [Actinomycetota bacterium]|nr:hypothetical protein [Actinomycetota bacterium]